MKIKSLSLGLLALVISMLFVPLLTYANFTDVPATHANYDAITYLQDKGIIKGYDDGTFKPDKEINRVETLKIILLAAAVEIDSTATSSKFSDTPAGSWYSALLNKAVELKIVSGYPDGTFLPNKTVNLVEALKMVQLAFAIDMSAITVTADPYADTPKDIWYAKYVQYAKDNHLIDADSANKVYPSQFITRGKLSEIIYRLLKLEQPVVIDPVIEPEVPEIQQTTDISLDIAIQKYIFSPKEITVGLGTTLVWKNTSTIDHTVTSDTAVFDSGTLGPNDTFEYKFDKLGTYSYHCKNFPTMTGTITVKPAYQVPTI